MGWEAAAEIWGEVRALEEEVGKMRRSAAAEQVRVLRGFGREGFLPASNRQLLMK